MTLMLKQVFAFFRMLNSETGHNQIAAGLACGLILGFAPFFSLQTFLIIFILLFFRIQMGAAFLAAFFFKFVAFLLDPVCDVLGRKVLEMESLKDIFTTLYHAPIVPMTRFNNSIVMGSMVLTIVLAPLAFFAFRSAILKYRVSVVERFKATKFWKTFAATKFYNWYTKYEDLYGSY